MTITYRQRKILTYVALHRRYWHSLYRVWGKDVVELQNKGLLTKRVAVSPSVRKAWMPL